MPKQKSPKDPTRFSIRLSKQALRELNRLTRITPDVDNRNAMINKAVMEYILHEKYRPLVHALEGLFRAKGEK